MKGERRLDWLEGVRALDLALRGPRPPAGLDGVSVFLSDWTGRGGPLRKKALAWWQTAVAPVAHLDRPGDGITAFLAALRKAASALSGDHVWAGPGSEEQPYDPQSQMR